MKIKHLLRERQGLSKMIYVYTAPNCPRCNTVKAKLKANNSIFEERSADRIKSPQDEIDREAMVEASFINMQLPIVVEV